MEFCESFVLVFLKNFGIYHEQKHESCPMPEIPFEVKRMRAEHQAMYKSIWLQIFGHCSYFALALQQRYSL